MNRVIPGNWILNTVSRTTKYCHTLVVTYSRVIVTYQFYHITSMLYSDWGGSHLKHLEPWTWAVEPEQPIEIVMFVVNNGVLCICRNFVFRFHRIPFGCWFDASSPHQRSRGRQTIRMLNLCLMKRASRVFVLRERWNRNVTLNRPVWRGFWERWHLQGHFIFIFMFGFFIFVCTVFVSVLCVWVRVCVFVFFFSCLLKSCCFLFNIVLLSYFHFFYFFIGVLCFLFRPTLPLYSSFLSRILEYY